MKKILIFIIIILIICGCSYGLYNHLISSPSKDDLIFEFDVAKGSTYSSIAEDLEREKFIRSSFA